VEFSDPERDLSHDRLFCTLDAPHFRGVFLSNHVRIPFLPNCIVVPFNLHVFIHGSIHSEIENIESAIVIDVVGWQGGTPNPLTSPIQRQTNLMQISCATLFIHTKNDIHIL